MSSRMIHYPTKDVCTYTDGVVTRSKYHLDSSILVEMCHTRKIVLTTLAPGFVTSINGCVNNSACDSSCGFVNSEDSTNKEGPGISSKTLPEAMTSKSVASSTPDSVLSANMRRQQPCSYLELFIARRKLGQHMKRQIALREQHISTVKKQADTYIRPSGVWLRSGRTNSTDTPKHVREDTGYATMPQYELKERSTRALRRSPAESPRGRYSGLSKFTDSSPSNDQYGISSSDQFVERHVQSNKTRPSANLVSSLGLNRTRWTPSSTLEEEMVPPSIGHINHSNVHPVFGCATGSKGRDLQMKDRSRNVVNKHRLIKGGKRKHETSSIFYPDPELVRIYGGSKTTANTRKSPRKVRNMNQDSCHGGNTSEGSRISDKSYQDGTKTSEYVRTDASEMLGKKSQAPQDSETLSDRGTPVSVDMSGEIYVKGIMKSQNGNGRRSESLSAGSSSTENGAIRKVRFQCPEQDLKLAHKTQTRIRSPCNTERFEDNGYSTLDIGTKCQLYKNCNTNIRLQEQGRMSLTQSHKIEKEQYFRSSGSGFTSPLYLREVAALERNIPIIDHFKDVGDYDDLYPGNGEATRWNKIGTDWGTLETRALALTGFENTSVNIADSSRACIQMSAQNENNEALGTSGFVTRQHDYRNAGNVSPGRSSQKRAWSVLSNGSNEESEDGRASGDGGYCTTLDIVSSNGRVSAEKGERGRSFDNNGINRRDGDTNMNKHRSYQEGMGSSHCCCTGSDSSREKEHDHSASMSNDFLNASLETSKRQQAAVESLERALKQGIMLASSINRQIGYTNGPTLRHRRNVNSESHVDVIDRKALEERMQILRQKVPMPPRVRYRNKYDNSSENNNCLWNVDLEHIIPIP